MIASGADVAVFPAASVSVTVMFQMPSLSDARVHAFEVIVHETLVEPSFEAVSTAVPANGPATLNVGVLSLVRLSEFDWPRSEAIAKSGVAGVAIAVALITTLVSADDALDSIPLMFCETTTE